MFHQAQKSVTLAVLRFSGATGSRALARKATWQRTPKIRFIPPVCSLHLYTHIPALGRQLAGRGPLTQRLHEARPGFPAGGLVCLVVKFGAEGKGLAGAD